MRHNELDPIWVRGGLAIAALGLLAILLHWLLESFLGASPVLFLYPAACVAAWLYGVRASRQTAAENHRRYEELAETANLIPWEADARTGAFSYVGPQAADVLGYPVDDWSAPEFWINAIYPEDRNWRFRPVPTNPRAVTGSKWNTGC